METFNLGTPVKVQSFRSDIIGMDKALVNLARLVESVNSKAAKGVYFKAGEVVANKAEALAPFNFRRNKGTHLVQAIYVNAGPLIFSNVLVGVSFKRRGGAPHALLVEFGTSRSSAWPFMRPAASSSAGEVETVLRDGLNEIIASAVK